MNKFVFALKKFFLFFTIIFCCLISSGCINLKMVDEYTINSDLSAEHSFEYLVGDNLYMLSNQINDGIYENLEDAGFENITNIHNDNYFGMKGSQHINQFDFNDIKQNDYIQIEDHSKDYYIFKYINIDVNINLEDFINDKDSEGLVNLDEYKFTLNLPIRFIKTNAETIFNDGKSATWIFYQNPDNFMHFETIMPNWRNIKIVSICSVGIIGLFILLKLILLLFKSNKKSDLHQNDEKKCPNCSYLIKGNDEFCGNCGTKILKYCPQCGCKNFVDADFCGNCGTKFD